MATLSFNRSFYQFLEGMPAIVVRWQGSSVSKQWIGLFNSRSLWFSFELVTFAGGFDVFILEEKCFLSLDLVLGFSGCQLECIRCIDLLWMRDFLDYLSTERQRNLDVGLESKSVDGMRVFVRHLVNGDGSPISNSSMDEHQMFDNMSQQKVKTDVITISFREWRDNGRDSTIGGLLDSCHDSKDVEALLGRDTIMKMGAICFRAPSDHYDVGGKVFDVCYEQRVVHLSDGHFATDFETSLLTLSDNSGKANNGHFSCSAVFERPLEIGILLSIWLVAEWEDITVLRVNVDEHLMLMSMTYSLRLYILKRVKLGLRLNSFDKQFAKRFQRGVVIYPVDGIGVQFKMIGMQMGASNKCMSNGLVDWIVNYGWWKANCGCMLWDTSGINCSKLGSPKLQEVLQYVMYCEQGNGDLPTAGWKPEYNQEREGVALQGPGADLTVTNGEGMGRPLLHNLISGVMLVTLKNRLLQMGLLCQVNGKDVEEWVHGTTIIWANAVDAEFMWCKQGCPVVKISFFN